MRAHVITGSGRYADPWHPFAETGAILADLLRAEGFDVAVYDELVAVLQDPPSSSVAGLAHSLEHGIGVHGALASLRDHPSWAPAIGALWLPDLSWHPP